MIDLNKEREAFLGFLRTKGVIKAGWNSLGVLTNLVREAGCSLSYNDIELMQESWMEKAKAQVVTGWISVNDRLPAYEELVLIKTNKGVVQGYLFQDEEYSEMKGEYMKFDGWQDDFHDEFIEYEDVTHWMKLPNEVSDSGLSGFKYQIQPLELPENLFNWFHPDIELFDTIEEGAEAYTREQWEQLQVNLGVKIETQLLDYDEIPNIPEDAIVWPNWKPQPPELGYFLIAAFDSENGPVLWWANPNVECKEG